MTPRQKPRVRPVGKAKKTPCRALHRCHPTTFGQNNKKTRYHLDSARVATPDPITVDLSTAGLQKMRIAVGVHQHCATYIAWHKSVQHRGAVLL